MAEQLLHLHVFSCVPMDTFLSQNNPVHLWRSQQVQAELDKSLRPRNVSSLSSCKVNTQLDCSTPQTNTKKELTKNSLHSAIGDKKLCLQRLQIEVILDIGGETIVINLLLLNARAQVRYMCIGVLPNRQKPREGRTWQDLLPSYICSHMLLKYTTVVLNNKQLQSFSQESCGQQKHQNNKDMFIRFSSLHVSMLSIEILKVTAHHWFVFSPLKHKSAT